MIQRITRQNRRHIRHHFISIPRPSDADQDSEFYWPLDETGRKRRIQFIEEILKKLKNAYEIKKPGADIPVRKTT